MTKANRVRRGLPSLAPSSVHTQKVWLGEQETPYSCGPASLKYALCILGYAPKEAQLRRLARTTWRGTPTKKLMAAARRFGLHARLKLFVDDEFVAAWEWLCAELDAGRPVILDVEGFAHYVVAVQLLDGGVVVIDPEGQTTDGSDYADIGVYSRRRLRNWWLSGDEEGEPDAFRGIALAPTSVDGRAPRTSPRPRRPRLSFSREALRRYRAGRPWILDEYLIDVVDIAAAVAGFPGIARPLGDVVRAFGESWLAARVSFWHEATAAEVQMAKAHVEDIAVAAEAMGLTAPDHPIADARVAVDVAALLMAMLKSWD